MVFSSNIFLFAFLPCTLLGYYLINPRFRNCWLLCSSLLFYAWGGRKVGLLLLLFSIILNYSGGIAIDFWDKRHSKIKPIILFIVIALNLGTLFYFKYLNFVVVTFNDIFSRDWPIRDIVLPIGISFFTFQGMSYVIDLYRKQVAVQRNPLYVALYISLFPQLIAGPIVRYRDIAEQIETRQCTIELFGDGTKRFIFGLGKKVLLANQVAAVADEVFTLAPTDISMGLSWLGILCYSLQIYFDFSGYSDMAIGLGKMFGFRFLENFNYPYISSSVREFWKRWHISLSSWFRDYLYIPLGGNRRGNTYINLMIVFLATGLWHGASWNFVIWGAWNGLFLIAERIISKGKTGATTFSVGGWVYTAFVVILGWVFFRSPDIGYAFSYIASMFSFQAGAEVYLNSLNSRTVFFMAIAIIGCMPIHRWIHSRFHEKQQFINGLEFVFMVTVLFFSIVQIVISAYNPFIYYRF